MGIATLGPKGTDSETAALTIKKLREIPGEIVLCRSFQEAVEHSVNNNSYALIPAAYIKKDSEGRVIDSFGDLNFRESRIELIDSFILPLKEMCMARRAGCFAPGTIALHPATEIFARDLPELTRIRIDSKPLAVRACSEGKADMCIGSRDVVESFGNLEIVRRMKPTMLWALYQPRLNDKEYN